jgi:hypothetical protein
LSETRSSAWLLANDRPNRNGPPVPEKERAGRRGEDEDEVEVDPVASFE